MATIEGKYLMETSDKFDEFMKAIGVGMVMRKMANCATPAVEITLKDGQYTLKTATTFKTTEITFKLGEEFDESTADGRDVKATLTLDGMKLTHKQVGNKEKKEKDSTLTRTFSEKGFDMELVCEDVTCTRFYKRTE